MKNSRVWWVMGVAVVLAIASTILLQRPPASFSATPSSRAEPEGGAAGSALEPVGSQRTAVLAATPVVPPSADREDTPNRLEPSTELPRWSGGTEDLVFDDGVERGVLVRPGFVHVLDSEGRIVAEGAWADGEKHGHWKYYEDEGSLSMEGVYIAGVADGEWTGYMPDGSISRQVNIRGGKFHGQCMFYVPFTHDESQPAFLSGVYEDGVLIEQY